MHALQRTGDVQGGGGGGGHRVSTIQAYIHILQLILLFSGLHKLVVLSDVL